jgi:hypothetical protein
MSSIIPTINRRWRVRSRLDHQLITTHTNASISYLKRTTNATNWSRRRIVDRVIRLASVIKRKVSGFRLWGSDLAEVEINIFDCLLIFGADRLGSVAL